MNCSVNLLPMALRRGEILRRRARQWGTVWTLGLALAAAIVGARLVLRDGAQSARIEAERRQAERLAKAETRLADARARLAMLRSQEAAMLNPADEASGLLVLGIVSRCAARDEGAVQVESFAISRKQTPPSAPTVTHAAPRNDPRLLTLKGIASDSLTVAAFAAGLRDAGVFASVERKPAESPSGDARQPVPYLIECTF